MGGRNIRKIFHGVGQGITNLSFKAKIKACIQQNFSTQGLSHNLILDLLAILLSKMVTIICTFNLVEIVIKLSKIKKVILRLRHKSGWVVCAAPLNNINNLAR